MKNFTLELPELQQLKTDVAEIKQLLHEQRNQNSLGDIWLNSNQAAEVLGITTRTLQEMRNRGDIPFSQHGKMIRFRAADLQQFLMDHFIKTRNQESIAS